MGESEATSCCTFNVKSWIVFEPLEEVDVMAKEYDPIDVGVPDKTPDDERVIPGGSEPEVTLKVGLPVDGKV